MKRKFVRFFQDELGDWIALLSCGHKRHVRHRPPWMNRSWVMTKEGRKSRVGTEIHCKLCHDLYGADDSE